MHRPSARNTENRLGVMGLYCNMYTIESQLNGVKISLSNITIYVPISSLCFDFMVLGYGIYIFARMLYFFHLYQYTKSHLTC